MLTRVQQSRCPLVPLVPSGTRPVISDRMLETDGHHAMFGESAVSHQESQLAERGLVDHLGRWWWAMVGIPHISPGGVHMGPVWYGQSKK